MPEPRPDPPRSRDLTVLSREEATDLESAESILGLLSGWSAAQLDEARRTVPTDAENVARWEADSEHYASLWRRVYSLSPQELRQLVEELGPVARRAVEGA